MNSTIITLATLASTQALAQPYEIQSSTFSPTTTLEGAGYAITGTVGQANADDPVTISDGYQIRSGFVPTTVATSQRLCADQNDDGALNGLDFGAWLGNFNAADPRADVNQDNSVNGLDFGAWLRAFNQGDAGPTCGS